MSAQQTSQIAKQGSSFPMDFQEQKNLHFENLFKIFGSKRKTEKLIRKNLNRCDINGNPDIYGIGVVSAKTNPDFYNIRWDKTNKLRRGDFSNVKEKHNFEIYCKEFETVDMIRSTLPMPIAKEVIQALHEDFYAYVKNLKIKADYKPWINKTEDYITDGCGFDLHFSVILNDIHNAASVDNINREIRCINSITDYIAKNPPPYNKQGCPFMEYINKEIRRLLDICHRKLQIMKPVQDYINNIRALGFDVSDRRTDSLHRANLIKHDAKLCDSASYDAHNNGKHGKTSQKINVQHNNYINCLKMMAELTPPAQRYDFEPDALNKQESKDVIDALYRDAESFGIILAQKPKAWPKRTNEEIARDFILYGKKSHPLNFVAWLHPANGIPEGIELLKDKRALIDAAHELRDTQTLQEYIKRQK